MGFGGDGGGELVRIPSCVVRILTESGSNLFYIKLDVE
jgi:hypothetical protein